MFLRPTLPISLDMAAEGDEPPARLRDARSRIMYVELKSGYNDDGPAWISRVYFSKTGQTVYFHGKTLRHVGRGRSPFNHVEVETGEEYWISGVKKNRQDRHWAGSGLVEIDPDVREEYLKLVGSPG